MLFIYIVSKKPIWFADFEKFFKFFSYFRGEAKKPCNSAAFVVIFIIGNDRRKS